MTILGAVKAGVHVVHAARNAGSKPSSIVSYGPWLTSVGATTMDRSYSAYLYTNDGRGSHVNISNPYQDSHPLSVNFGVCVDVFCRAGDEKFRRDLLQLVRLTWWNIPWLAPVMLWRSRVISTKTSTVLIRQCLSRNSSRERSLYVCIMSFIVASQGHPKALLALLPRRWERLGWYW